MSPLYEVPTRFALVSILMVCAATPSRAGVVRVAVPLGSVFSTLPSFMVTDQPPVLALVMVFQYAEGLSDEQAETALRSRIDWKYALSLPLEDAGLDASVFSEFRTRLVVGGAEQRLLDRLLELCRERKLLKERGRQRTDSTHVVAAIGQLNRLENVGETMRNALNVLAQVAPE